MSEADRQERANARRARGMTVERIESLDVPVAYHDGESVAALPGEVYVPEHVAS